MKPWLKWIVLALIVALLAAGTLRLLSARKEKQTALDAQQAAQKTEAVVTLAATDLVQALPADLVQSLAISGPIKAVNSAFVKARVAGELQGLTVREGDVVKAGDVIARVDPTESQSRVHQAQQQAQAAKAQVDIAQRSFDNNRSLVDQGFISKTALDTSLATLASAQANYRAALASVDMASKSLQDTVLRSPIAGLVAQRLAQPGERVAVDARIVEVVDLRRLELEASLSPADSLAVKVGQSAQLTVEGASEPMSAKVVRINPSAQAGSRAVLAYLAVEPNPGLRQGLFAQGTLNVGMHHTLVLPLSAVRTDKPQPYVQWVHNDRVEHQAVELGARGVVNDIPLVGVQGIAENAWVLNAGVGALRAGTRVQRAAPAGAK